MIYNFLIFSNMKNSSHLVSRCVYMNILRMTNSKDVLENFINDGGWAIVNAWLVDAKTSENPDFILELLKVNFKVMCITNYYNIYLCYFCLMVCKFVRTRFIMTFSAGREKNVVSDLLQ